MNKKEAKAIVHAHSTCATAVSTHQKDIPAFHYMVAVAGGEDIKCALNTLHLELKIYQEILLKLLKIDLHV